MLQCTADGVRISIQSPSKPLKAGIINPKFMMLSCFVYQKFSFNELSHRKLMNNKILSPFMTCNVSNVIAKNNNKSGTTLSSQSLIPLNKVFHKQKKFGTSNDDQMLKLASN